MIRVPKTTPKTLLFVIYVVQRKILIVFLQNDNEYIFFNTA